MSRGRNKECIERRNARLVERWLYWTEDQRRRFDDALAIHSKEEFFLSESRIMKLLRDNLPDGTRKVPKPVRHRLPKPKAWQLSLFEGD